MPNTGILPQQILDRSRWHCKMVRRGLLPALMTKDGGKLGREYRT